MSLKPPGGHEHRYAATLSHDEKDRATRLVFDGDRKRFIVGRGILRCVLASYLGREPKALRFKYGERGKPALTHDGRDQGLNFNLAHSGDLMVLAVTTLCGLGVDVEELGLSDEPYEVAMSTLSAIEKEDLRALPDGQRWRAFVKLWTRKEAYSKATGEGLCGALAGLELPSATYGVARLAKPYGNALSCRSWSILELAPARNFVGALAAPMRDFQLKCWRWIE